MVIGEDGVWYGCVQLVAVCFSELAIGRFLNFVPHWLGTWHVTCGCDAIDISMYNSQKHS